MKLHSWYVKVKERSYTAADSSLHHLRSALSNSLNIKNDLHILMRCVIYDVRKPIHRQLAPTYF